MGWYQYANLAYLFGVTSWLTLYDTMDPIIVQMYIVVDTIRLFLYPREYPTRQRRNQLIMHHVATLILLAKCDEYQFRDFMMLEWSTIFVMMNKLFKLGGQFRNFTIFMWVFIRVLYLPIILGVYLEQVTYIEQVSAILIFMLGLTWTYEYIGVTINPLTCTSIASFAPLLLRTDGWLFYHTSAMVMSIVTPWQWIVSNSYLFHTMYVNPSLILSFCYLMVGICDYLDRDIHVPRDWNNLEKSYLCIAMNLWFGLGVYYSLV